MARITDIPHNDSDAAMEYLKAEYKRTGTVSAETLEILSMMQRSSREFRKRVAEFLDAQS